MVLTSWSIVFWRCWCVCAAGCMCNQISKHATHQSYVMLVMPVLSDHCLTAVIFQNLKHFIKTVWWSLLILGCTKYLYKYDLCKHDACLMIKSLWLLARQNPWCLWIKKKNHFWKTHLPFVLFKPFSIMRPYALPEFIFYLNSFHLNPLHCNTTTDNKKIKHYILMIECK